MKQMMLVGLTALLAGCLVSQPGAAPTGAGPSAADEQAAGGAAATVPGQWSLREREYWKYLMEELETYVAQMNKDCGAQISAVFDYESFRPHWKPSEGNYGLDAYDRAHMVTPVSAVRDVCVIGDMQKEAVRGGIEQIVITYGTGKESAKPKLTLDKGTFHVVIEPQHKAAGSWHDEVMELIKRQL